MTDALRRCVLLNVAWMAGLVLVVGVLIGGSVVRLGNRQARVSALEEEIHRKHEELRKGTASADRLARLETTEAVLLDCRAMADDEGRRIAQLSITARSAGMTIVSLRSSATKVAEDDLIASCAHRLQGVGTYRQLARFLEGVYSMDGMAAIDEMELRRGDSEDRDLLEASMRVTWYAAAPPAELATEKLAR